MLHRGLTEAAGTGTQLRFGQIVLDLHYRLVTRCGHEIGLSPTEYAVLVELALAGGAPVTREQLSERVWGVPLQKDSRNISQYIYRLRQKLEADPLSPAHIITITGIGFRLREVKQV